MDRDIVIKLDGITKTYRGSDVLAVDRLSLEVERGARFGLLGPNGAGKTTTINILCGLLNYDGGSVSINGMKLEKKYRKIRSMIGLVPQDIALYETLSARENLRFIGEMYGLRGKKLMNRIEECLSMVGLAENGHRQIRKYSGGMKRRINLAAGIMHEPGILILDEPTTGVDVQSRTMILEFLREINARGTTIIYTSHYLEEAEELCTSIAIMDHGRMIIGGNTNEIIGSHKEYKDLESVFLHLTGRKLRD